MFKLRMVHRYHRWVRQDGFVLGQWDEIDASMAGKETFKQNLQTLCVFIVTTERVLLQSWTGDHYRQHLVGVCLHIVRLHDWYVYRKEGHVLKIVSYVDGMQERSCITGAQGPTTWEVTRSHDIHYTVFGILLLFCDEQKQNQESHRAPLDGLWLARH